MGLKIYNTLTGEKEEFNPLHPPRVRMYACGPTVYDDPHIGHIRGAFVFDVIRKYLQYKKFEVKFVRNLTDVDDKIIEKARQESRGGVTPPLQQACEQVALRYTDAYHQALEKLGIDSPDEEPKATQQIPKMIEMIQHLIGKGMAYAAQGSVYFSVNGFKEYGKLSHQSLEQLLKGHRMEPEAGKKDPLDFALWKNAKPEEPQWPSPWGPGRPGWHIECSVMSQAQFGETLDIHGGGVDLVFPHHENEIAQSEAAWGTPFANYWLHNGLLTVEGQKMSKSVGNVIGIDDILAKGYHPDDLKLFFLQSHYRSPVDFTWKKMEEMRKIRERFQTFFYECQSRKISEDVAGITDKNILDIETRVFVKAMDEDFNTPVALVAIHMLYTDGQITILNRSKNNVTAQIQCMIKKIGAILGLFKVNYPLPTRFPVEWLSRIDYLPWVVRFLEEFRNEEFAMKDCEDILEKIKDRDQYHDVPNSLDKFKDKILRKRDKLREEKKYTAADHLRERVEKIIEINDTAEGSIGKWRSVPG